MTRRFVVCDPSLTSRGGHYLEYDQIVLRAAERHGFLPLLIANKSYIGSSETSYKTYSLFDFDIWGLPSAAATVGEASITNLDRRMLRLKYSSYGILWEASRHLRAFQHYNSAYPLPIDAIARIRRYAGVRRLAEQIEADFTSADGASEAGLPEGPRLRAKRYHRWERAVHEALKMTGAASAHLGYTAPAGDSQGEAFERRVLDALQRSAAVAECFRRNMEQMFDLTELQSDDHIFFPNMSFLDLSGLTQFLKDKQAAHLPWLHILYRRNVYEGYSNSFDDQEWRVHAIRSAIVMAASQPGSERIRFYTDTERLTDQFDRFDGPQFGTLPVPVEVEVTASRTSAAPESDNATVVYIGDSRSNDRFQSIIDVASQMDGAMRLVVQPFHSSAISGAAAELVRLKEWQDIVVTKCDLSAAEVEEQISRATVLLVDADRSQPLPPRAGSFWTAISHRRTVVVRAGTSLSDLIDSTTALYHREALKSASIIAEAPCGDPNQWRSYSPVSDVECSGAVTADGLLIDTRTHRYMRLRMPENGAHLWVTFRLRTTARRADVAVLAAAQSEDRSDLANHRTVVGGPDGSTLSVLIPPVAGAHSVWLAFQVAWGPETAVLDSLRASFVRTSATVAAEAIGVKVYAEPTDFDFGRRVVEACKRCIADAPLLTRCYDFLSEERIAAAAEALEQPQTIVATYLGDARKEKGFHHLPKVVQYMNEQRRRGVLHFRLQSYMSVENIDPSMLVSEQMLRMMDGGVELIETPLDTDLYNRELARADVVLVPYERANYIARSSGIFAQALAAGKPSIVPAGTWMSSVLDSLSYQYHEEQIDEHGDVLATARYPGAAQWRIYDNGKDVAVPPERMINGQVLLRNNDACYCRFVLTGAEDYVRISFRHHDTGQDTHVSLLAGFQTTVQGGEEMANSYSVVGGKGPGPFSILLHVPEGARSIWLGFSAPYSAKAPVAISDVEVKSVSTQGVAIPRMACGLSYVGGGDDQTAKQISQALSEILQTYSGFKESAARYAASWRDRNSGDMLVAQLASSAAKPNGAERSRFRIADWAVR